MYSGVLVRVNALFKQSFEFSFLKWSNLCSVTAKNLVWAILNILLRAVILKGQRYVKVRWPFWKVCRSDYFYVSVSFKYANSWATSSYQWTFVNYKMATRPLFILKHHLVPSKFSTRGNQRKLDLVTFSRKQLCMMILTSQSLFG